MNEITTIRENGRTYQAMAYAYAEKRGFVKIQPIAGFEMTADEVRAENASRYIGIETDETGRTISQHPIIRDSLTEVHIAIAATTDEKYNAALKATIDAVEAGELDKAKAANVEAAE